MSAQVISAGRHEFRLRLILGIIAPLVLIGIIWWRWPTVAHGLSAMSRADGEWLVLAGVAATLTWAAASCCQLGSTMATLPLRRVFAVQVAGSFVNHVLPAGIGVAGLNLRMLRRCGLTRERAAGAVSLNLAAGIVLHVVTLCVLVALESSSRYNGHALLPMLLTVAGACVLITGSGWLLSRRSDAWRTRFRDLLTESRTVLCHPRRSLLLWTGSAAIPALHIVTLAAVLHSLNQSAPTSIIALAYLSASAAAAVVPSPGGFGSLDVALLTALTATGMTAQAAVSAIIGYRLITVWIPLVPGAGSLLVLLHRRAV